MKESDSTPGNSGNLGLKFISSTRDAKFSDEQTSEGEANPRRINIFSFQKLLLIFVFLFALGLRIEHRTVFYSLGYDKSRQIIASGNYFKGNGVSDCTTTVKDLSQITCKPQTLWAAGYPVILGWMYYLTKDFLTADFILICLGLSTLFVAAYFVFRAVDHSRSPVISPYFLFLLFSAFSFSPYHYLGTTDLLALAFFVAGIAFSLGVFKIFYFLPSFMSGLLFFLTAFLKYSFYPFLVIIPFSLMLVWFLKRERKFVYSAIVYTLPVIAGFLLLQAFFPEHVMNQDAKTFPIGWNWHHLLQFDPFAVKAFFFLDPIWTRIESRPALWLLVRIGFLAISALLILFFFMRGASHFKKKIAANAVSAEFYVYLLGVITISINILYLMWLSVRLPPFPQSDNPNWSLVWETRYYIPSIFFLFVFVFSQPFKANLQSAMLRKATGFLAALSIIMAVAYWSWKHYDVFVNKRLAGTYYAEGEEAVKLGRFIKTNLPKENKPVVLGFLNYGSAYGGSRLIKEEPVGYNVSSFDEDFTTDKLLISKSNATVLYFILPKELNEEESRFIESQQGSKLFELAQSNLYRIEIKSEH